MNDSLKYCNDLCKGFKQKHLFRKDVSRNDGLQKRCVQCNSVRNKKIYEDNKETVLFRTTQYRESNKQKMREAGSKNYFKNKTAIRYKRLKRVYGVSEKQVTLLFIAQKGCCAICLRHQNSLKNELSVDHNHQTGEIRGLLCNRRNTVLGLLWDSKKVFGRLLRYISKSFYTGWFVPENNM